TSKDELIKKFFSVEFTRFYNYYQKARDLNVSDNGRAESTGGDSTRYFINVGRKDGFDWMSLKDFLKEVLELGRDDVFKVETKDSFSFFNTESEHQQK
ncbi:DbpA RNA binding domain-containing protein, partial [Seonamhaeicola marinus]